MARPRNGRARGSILDISHGKGTRWLVRISLGPDHDGHQRKRWNKNFTGTKKEAQRLLTAQLTKLDGGLPVKTPRLTLRGWLEDWQRLYRDGVSPRTRADTAHLIRHRIAKAPFYDQRLTEIAPASVQSWVKDMSDSGLAPRTVRMAYGVLSQALKKAVGLAYVPRNVAKVEVELPQLPKRPLRALTQEEAQRLLVAAREDRLYALFLVLLTGGLRPGEAFGLQWQDLEGSLLRVRRSVVRLTGQPYALRPPKTDRERTVPLPAMTVAAIEEFRATLPPAYQAPEAFMFPNGDGHPLEHNNFVHRHFKPALKRAKLPDHRLYDLRHSCATLLLRDGEQIKVVSERLGHKDIKLTLDVYTHVQPGMGEAAAARFDTLLKPKLKLA